ncbi:hypothetical protein VPH35_060281 [Triticum aestivum]
MHPVFSWYGCRIIGLVSDLDGGYSESGLLPPDSCFPIWLEGKKTINPLSNHVLHIFPCQGYASRATSGGGNLFYRHYVIYYCDIIGLPCQLSVKYGGADCRMRSDPIIFSFKGFFEYLVLFERL